MNRQEAGMTQTLLPRADRLTVCDVDLEVVRRGSGRVIVFLHGFHTLDPNARFLELLSRRAAVLAPSHPGFGASFGGWLAAEIAASCPHRLDRLVLVDALGIKLGDRETPDILDVFNTHPDTVRRLSWHDPRRSAPDFDALSDEALTRHARNWEALCLYGWEPYMYNPRLTRWLGRIEIPTLVLWGESDGVVKPAYGRAYASLIPGARFALIDGAGHHPELERPDALADRVFEFLGC